MPSSEQVSTEPLSLEHDPRLLETIIVNLGLDAKGPWARPRAAEAYLHIDGGDSVRFQSAHPFTVRFKGESPFAWTVREGEADGGLFVAYGTVRDNALGPGVTMKGYEYGMTVGGETEDPEVVVKKDPRG